MIVKLIDKDQNEYEMEYYKVNDFCKMLCYKKENIELFNEFKKDYTYYDPYFDFVIFELGYEMENALFEDETILAVNGEIFKETSALKGYVFAHMTKCSDSILRIEKDDYLYKDCLVDPNGFNMMSNMRANIRGNHTVTSRTILNQVLIQNKKICEYFEDSMIRPVDIMSSLGFFRVINFDGEKFIVGLEGIMTPEQALIFGKRNIEYSGEAEEIEKEFVQDYLDIVKSDDNLRKAR